MLFVAAWALVIAAGARVVATQQTPPTAAASSDAAAGQSALEEECSLCHESSLIAGPFRTPAEWNELLDRMGSYGADVREPRRGQILTFLLRSYGKANVNQAKAPELAAVLDMPREIADAIVMHRSERGPFTTLDDLKAVPNLDAAKLEKRKDRLTF